MIDNRRIILGIGAVALAAAALVDSGKEVIGQDRVEPTPVAPRQRVRATMLPRRHATNSKYAPHQGSKEAARRKVRVAACK